MKIITQRTLAQFTTLQNKMEKLSEEICQMKGELIDALQAGAKVETGARIAKVKAEERRSVCWKQVVIRLKSLGYANLIISKTKPTPFFKLVVK